MDDLSSPASVATNRNAIVFNPATAYLAEYPLPLAFYTGNVTSYVVEGEILDSLSVVLGKNIGTEVSLTPSAKYDISIPMWDSQQLATLEPAAAVGQYIGQLFSNLLDSSAKKHDIDVVIELLEPK